jgi:hypothetical protein
VTAPTLLIAAANDKVIPRASTEQLLARFAGGIATLGTRAGADHNFADSHPDYVRLLRGELAPPATRRVAPPLALGAERLLRAAHPGVDPGAARLAARIDGVEAKQRLEGEAGALGDLPAALVVVVHAQLDAARAERIEGEPRHRPVASVTMPRPPQPVLRQ